MSFYGSSQEGIMTDLKLCKGSFFVDKAFFYCLSVIDGIDEINDILRFKKLLLFVMFSFLDPIYDNTQGKSFVKFQCGNYFGVRLSISILTTLSTVYSSN